MKRFAKTLSTIVAIVGVLTFSYVTSQQTEIESRARPTAVQSEGNSSNAHATLESLLVKGRAAKTGYSRSQFGTGWTNVGGCDMRNVILKRDLTDVVTNGKCQVISGVLNDPYTGASISFMRGVQSSQAVQIDHIVSLSNAWQTGAQQLPFEERVAFANDSLTLIAVDGRTNQQKSDGDAATWLPPAKNFRCEYVSRQISVKAKYKLWVTPAEKGAMQQVLDTC